MKSTIPPFTATCAMLLLCVFSARSETPAIFTSLHQIHILTNAQARPAQPVSFEATVTYFRWYEHALFVQDGEDAIYVAATTDARLEPGDRVLIKGTVAPSFSPVVVSDNITMLRHGPMPNPLLASYDDLIRLPLDCRLVTVHAVVRSADLVLSSDRHSTILELLSGGGNIRAIVDSDDGDALNNLLDAEVDVTGAVSGVFDGKMQRTGLALHVSSLADVKVLKRATASPWSLPIMPMDQMLDGYRVYDSTQRYRVQGTITFYRPGSVAVLQNGSKSLWIFTQSRAPLQVGDLADATGFPDVHTGFLALTQGEIQDSHTPAPVQPVPVSWQQLASSAHIYDLVSTKGQVVTAVREATQDEYVLLSDGHLFTAVYRHPTATSLMPLPPIKQIPVGSIVRVTGICIPENSNPYDYDKGFYIYLRTFDDIAVLTQPSWLNIRNLTQIAILLLLAMILVAIWGLLLMRKVHRQTSAMAARTEAEASLERRRSRILEDINGARPLAEIIEEIAEMVSFKLNGAPCCCQISGGARLGACPPEAARHRIVRMEIRGHSGPLLGEFIAGIDPHTQPTGDETEALAVGAGLAALAIESRRLYSDLLHRSEFDQLTEVHNRFSLDKRLEAQIEEARLKASIFGLIYIDLDKFKQINDQYGHNVGDLYLQEVALRMKGQLRAVDLLARLGGDEFAVLVPVVRSRLDVEEIAQRLERCFDHPFTVEELTLHGSASVGFALYPEGGDTKDTLLNAADAAMYAVKNSRQQVGKKA